MIVDTTALYVLAERIIRLGAKRATGLEGIRRGSANKESYHATKISFLVIFTQNTREAPPGENLQTNESETDPINERLLRDSSLAPL